MFNIKSNLKKFFSFFLKNKKNKLYLNKKYFDLVFFIENNFLFFFNKKIINFKETCFRVKAELENSKKKSENEIIKAYRYSIEDFSENLLPVLDSLESMLSNKSFYNVENFLEGIRLTLKIFSGVLNKKNIIFILPKVGDIFNPYKHLAVSVISCKEKENNTIVNVLQKGYYIFERVLRPALVVVNKVE